MNNDLNNCNQNIKLDLDNLEINGCNNYKPKNKNMIVIKNKSNSPKLGLNKKLDLRSMSNERDCYDDQN